MKGTLGKTMFTLPAIRNIMKCFPNETIIAFPTGEAKLNNKEWIVGIGWVNKIVKGDKMDLVYMSFGKPKIWREIIVMDNHARRQIYTLKRGQIATFYGWFTVAQEKGERRHYIFYAKGFNAWYVPKQVDIRAYEDNQIDDINNDQEKDMLNFLDDILKENE